jgi:hypothetical protein
VIVNAEIIALQRAIRDLQRERKQRAKAAKDVYEFGIASGLTAALDILRDHIKRLRKREAAK